MSYLVLARKFRPADFASVKGQDHVTITLANAIKRNKVSHAFLFCGPRGVGKTSVARALAKGLDCIKGPTATPCLSCTNCLEISESRSLAVREIDGASHNSVDNVREVIDTLRSLPAPGSRYKIYIIDEVHMLSMAAFNALLKSLEEPPPNTVFILATTEIHKIPETVISRCQRYDFRALDLTLVVEQLKKIVEAEKLDIDDEVLRMIARLSDGSMRDAQSLLDRVQSFSEGRVSAKDASIALGVVERRVLNSLSAAIISRDASKSLELVADVFASGVDPPLFFDDFVSHWRDLMVTKVASGQNLRALDLAADQLSELSTQVNEVSRVDIQDLLHLAREGADLATRSAYPRYSLESLVVRMASRESVKDLASIIVGLETAGHNIAGSSSAKSPPEVSQFTESTRVAVPKGSAPISAAQGAEPTTKKSIDWNEFVVHPQLGRSPVLSEYLKRLSIQSFSPGNLIASGAKVAVEYLNDSSNRSKLIGLLKTYSGVSDWEIRLDISNGNTESAPSIVDQEKNREAAKRNKNIEEASTHPAVESLKRLFPGSVLEDELGNRKS